MGRVRDLDLLMKAGIKLVLVDVGASFGPFKPFRPLLPGVVYLGFDPDQREVREIQDAAFHRYIIMNKAVVSDPNAKSVHFYLTKHPACSSTLRPRHALIDNYLTNGDFDVVNEKDVSAITLSQALTETGLTRIDWLKLDTQGTDLRIIESIETGIADEIMAIDAEPGLDRYYEGEDTFSNLHDNMIGRGFWLADVDLFHQVRAPRKVLDQSFGVRGKVSCKVLQSTLKANPTAAMVRYLRTLNSLEARGATSEAYIRLWGCAFFSGNYPYASHVIQACGRAWPEEATQLEFLRNATTRRLRASVLWAVPKLARKMSWSNIRRLLIKGY